MKLMTDLNQDHGITVVMVTHEFDMAAFAKRVIRFVDGRVESMLQIGRRCDDLRNSQARASGNPAQRIAIISTVLGVVIGVGAVIAMITIGNGTTAKVTADLAQTRQQPAFRSAWAVRTRSLQR